MSRIFAWSGGALFVIALAWCAWWYIDRLGASSSGGGSPALVADAGLLTLFALHHSVFARTAVKTRIMRLVPSSLERSVYVWIASLLLILVCVWWRHIGGTLYDSGGWRAALHAAVQLSGVWLIAQSVAGIDPLELAGIRAPAIRGGLQTAGPYGWVRHPLYLGWVLAVFGAAHMTADRLAFAAITTFYLLVAVAWEERSLVDSFGDEYRRYQRRVRWRIVPYVF
jgi:methanethiol S-methyltransferase